MVESQRDAALDYLQFLTTNSTATGCSPSRRTTAAKANVARAVARNRASRQADRLLQPEAAEAKRAPTCRSCSRCAASSRSGRARPGVHADPEPALLRAQIESPRRSTCSVAAELAGSRTKSCSSSILRSTAGSPIPMARTRCWCPWIASAKFTERRAAAARATRPRRLPPRAQGRHARRHRRQVRRIDRRDQDSNKIRGTLIRPGQDLLITAAPTRHGACEQPRDCIARSAACLARSRDKTRRASRRHAVEHRALAWRDDGEHREQQRPARATTRSRSARCCRFRRTTTLASADAQAVDDALHDLHGAPGRHAVAHRHAVPRHLTDLLGWNGLNTRSMIKPGQRLVMYVAERSAGI